MKTISVIIPTYNRAKYIGRLLSQLLEQSEPPNEIIVVDDHSNDDTVGIVQPFAEADKRVRYTKNQGRYQRDAKATGLALARGEYIGFLDDDVLIGNRNFFQTLRTYLTPNTVIQTKVVLEQMGQKDERGASWRDRLTVRPYPVLELISARLNRGSEPRYIFPIIEFGNFWPAYLQKLFIDNNLILDAYGESYASALKLYRRNIDIILMPDLVIRHPGASSGGSKRFDKRRMTTGFTKFHYGYFTNMVYLHARYVPLWIWAWLPFYAGKAVVAVIINRDGKGFYMNAVRPMMRALWKFLIHRVYV